MMRSHNRLLIFLLLVFTLLPMRVKAGPSFESLSFKPALSESSFFSISQAQTLENDILYLSQQTEYQYKPLTITNKFGVKTDVITHLAATHLSLSHSLTPRFMLSLGMPFIFWERFTQVGGTEVGDKLGLGDLRLEGQYQLLRRHENNRLGVALQPFVTFPTGLKDIYAGYGGLTGGIFVIFEYAISAKSFVTLNTGVHARTEYNSGDAHSATDAVFNLGFGVETGQDANWFIEVQSRSPFDRFYADSHAVVLSSHTGFNFGISRLFKMKTAIGMGFFDGIGTPLFRVVVGISAKIPMRKTRHESIIALEPPPLPVPEEPQPPPQNKIMKTKRRFLPLY